MNDRQSKLKSESLFHSYDASDYGSYKTHVKKHKKQIRRQSRKYLKRDLKKELEEL